MAGLFDKQSDVYAAARPDYPEALYEFITLLVPNCHRVWDVGTGNGQAAIKLAEVFDEVIATDVSEQQLKQAKQSPKIKYMVTPKSISPSDLRSIFGQEPVDLVTVAQAMHWFNLDEFYENVRSVLRSGGVVAAWCYQLCYVDPAFDPVLKEFYDTTSPYWEPERKLVDEGYTTIRFPFQPAGELDSTGPFRFESRKELNLEQVIMYFRSWSAIQTSIDRGLTLLDDYKPAFVKAWGGDPGVVKTVTWPVRLLVGKHV